jgi:nitrogen regulatory protein PII
MARKSPLSGLFTRLQEKLSGTEPEKTQQKAANPAPPNLKLLFFIIDWNKANTISDVFDEEKVRFHFISKGIGTANNEILDLLGIGAGDKAVITCLEQEVMIPVLLKETRRKLGFHSPGSGIAFTIPLSAINDPVLLIFKQSIHKNEKITEAMKLTGDEGENMANEVPHDKIGKIDKNANDKIAHDLIISIINQGYSDEFMNTDREAGASGGTVINARGQAHEGAVKFFGISEQKEKELVLILTSREKKVKIMQAICEAHGLNSKAMGIVFSLPVDNVMGLSFE